MQDAGSPHLISELGSEDDGERLDRNKEVDPRRMPGPVFGSKHAASHNVMDMRMVLESPSPRVEDTEEAGHVASTMPLIGGELLHGLGRSLEKG